MVKKTTLGTQLDPSRGDPTWDADFVNCQSGRFFIKQMALSENLNWWVCLKNHNSTFFGKYLQTHMFYGFLNHISTLASSIWKAPSCARCLLCFSRPDFGHLGHLHGIPKLMKLGNANPLIVINPTIVTELGTVNHHLYPFITISGNPGLIKVDFFCGSPSNKWFLKWNPPNKQPSNGMMSNDPQSWLVGFTKLWMFTAGSPTIYHTLSEIYNWRYFKYGPGSKPQPTEHQNRC